MNSLRSIECCRPVLLAVAVACLPACELGETELAAGDTLFAGLGAAARTCQIESRNVSMPTEVQETSGLARAASDPDVFWTHNDAGNEPILFAVDATGRLIGRVPVTGADLVDWEDLEAAPCGERNCLYIGDIGDNDADRERITIYRLPEPASGATASEPGEPLHARYPDGPKDAEALFVAGAGEIFIVTKGQQGRIALYRYPATGRAGEVATLERVRDLFPEPAHADDRVTGASSTPDGLTVGIRTYRNLYLYPADRLLSGAAVDPMTYDLGALGEPQGEAVVLADDGTVWVTSEAGGGDEGRPRWSRLRCGAGDWASDERPSP